MSSCSLAALFAKTWPASVASSSRSVGFGFSAYLTYLELFMIEAICQWCVASAALMTLLLGVTAARAFRYVGVLGPAFRDGA